MVSKVTSPDAASIEINPLLYGEPSPFKSEKTVQPASKLAYYDPDITVSVALVVVNV